MIGRLCSDDHMVLVEAVDTTPGFLLDKLGEGFGVTFTVIDLGGGNEQIVIAASVPPGTSDHKVLVDGADTTPEFLGAKLAAGALIALATLNPGANEQVEIGVAPSATNGQAIITIGGVPTWSTNFQAQNLFTSGIYYAGSTVLNGEAAGSVVAVQTGSTAVRGIVSAQHSTDTNGAFFVGMKSRGTRGAPATVVNGDTLTKFMSMGYDGAAYIESAEIAFETDGVVGAGVVPQRIVFRVGTGVPTERFRIATSTVTPYVLQGTGNMSLTGALALGTAPSLMGNIRMPQVAAITVRNGNPGTADILWLLGDVSNNLAVGDDSRNTTTQIRAITQVLVNLGGTARLTVNTTRLEITTPQELSWHRDVASPHFTQQPRILNGAGQTLWTSAQSVVGGVNGSGGVFLASGGRPAGTGLPGSVQLALNTDDTIGNMNRLVELAEVAAGRRVLGFCRLGALTTVVLPAGTGDVVIYHSDAVTVPTVDAVSGYLSYSQSSSPAWRFNGINLRLDGTSATANAGAGAAVPATVDRFLQINIGGTTLKVPCFAT